jgi:cellulose synthase/poly-beta-1,6-N-acetylglucosamine synthase-like glycosyltransferase
MRISVLIPTWQRPRELTRCLAALDAQSRQPDQVMVVLRRSDDQTREALAAIRPRSFQPRVLEVDVPGVVAALNAGFASLTTDVVAVTDDDTAPRPDWLSRIERQFEADARLGGIGGRDWVHHDSHVEDGVRKTVGKLRWYGRIIGNHHLGAGPMREVDVLKGANMAYRRSALAGIRLDERLRGSGAQVHFEVDLSLMVKARSWRLAYDPAIAVDHYPASRPVGEERERPSGTALRDEIHNETYVILKGLPPSRRAPALLYWLGVGSRRAPGLAMLAERALREDDKGAVLEAFRATIQGRIAGIGTFRASTTG